MTPIRTLLRGLVATLLLAGCGSSAPGLAEPAAPSPSPTRSPSTSPASCPAERPTGTAPTPSATSPDPVALTLCEYGLDGGRFLSARVTTDPGVLGAFSATTPNSAPCLSSLFALHTAVVEYSNGSTRSVPLVLGGCGGTIDLGGGIDPEFSAKNLATADRLFDEAGARAFAALIAEAPVVGAPAATVGPSGAATWRPAAPPAPTDTEVALLVTETACASGQPADGRIEPPEVEYGDTTIIVTIRVTGFAGPSTCQGNPETPYTLELSEPVGQRDVVDGAP